MDVLGLIKDNPQLFCRETYHEIKPKRYIYRQGDPAEYIYFITKGVVRIVRVNYDGEEEVLTYEMAPNIVGIQNVFKASESEKAQISIISETVCEYHKILYSRVKQNGILEAMLITLGEQARRYRNIAAFLLENKSANAFCELLLHFSEVQSGQLVIQKWFKFMDLANYLKINISTISRIMKKLKEDKVIEVEKGQILILNEELLRKYASGMKVDY